MSLWSDDNLIINAEHGDICSAFLSFEVICDDAFSKFMIVEFPIDVLTVRIDL